MEKVNRACKTHLFGNPEFPSSGMYGLTSQMKRASVFISSNIAEGCGRHSDQELIRFLYIALGSASELETQIIISKKLSFLNETSFNRPIMKNESIIKMLTALLHSIKAKNKC